MKTEFYFYTLSIFLFSTLSAKSIVDCRVVTGGTTECNPFVSKFLHAKEIGYSKNKHDLIISKTLPVPKKKSLKVISVEDMIEKYVKIEESLRYKSSTSSIIPHVVKTVSRKKVNSKNNKYSIAKRRRTNRLRNRRRYIKPKIAQKKVIEKKISKIIPSSPKIKRLKTERVTYPSSVYIPNKKVENLSYGIYHVVSGDVLGRIANKFSITTNELLAINKLSKDTTLRIGQEFKIPLPQKIVDSIARGKYSIEPGDTILSIAYKFNIDPKELMKYNHMKETTLIREGKDLILPLPYIVKKLEAEHKKQALKKIIEEKKLQAKIARKNKNSIYNTKMIRGFGKRKLRVTATAYTSHRNQTDSTPFLAAWNNRIRPGMKILAVSRDLLTRYGMRNGTKVRIGGLKGYYTVRDKMNKRYKKRIDIYMGMNKRRALRWGRKSVNIYY